MISQKHSFIVNEINVVKDKEVVVDDILYVLTGKEFFLINTNILRYMLYIYIYIYRFPGSNNK